MSFGKGLQIEPGLYKQIAWNPDKPWQIQDSRWRKWFKQAKVRRERRRAKMNPECTPEYNRYHDWIL
jgi:hypothetical protein